MTPEEYNKNKLRQEEILKTFVEVRLSNAKAFNIIREKLTRIGFIHQSGSDRKTVCQSTHIFQKQGRYYIVHFKELYLLDGKNKSGFETFDRGVRDGVVRFLVRGELIEVLTPENYDEKNASQVNIIRYEDKNNWILKPMYNIGGPKRVKSE